VTVLVPGGTFAAPAKRITGLEWAVVPGIWARNRWWHIDTATEARLWQIDLYLPKTAFATDPTDDYLDVTWTYGGTNYTSATYPPDPLGAYSDHGEITAGGSGSGYFDDMIDCDVSGMTVFEKPNNYYWFMFLHEISGTTGPLPWSSTAPPDAVTFGGIHSFELVEGSFCVDTQKDQTSPYIDLRTHVFSYYTMLATITPSIYVEMVWVSTFSGERRFIIQCYVDQNLITGDPTGTGLTSSWVVDGTDYDGADYVKTNATFAKVQTYTHPTQIGSYDSVVDTDSGDVTYSRPYSFHVYESDHGNNVVSGLDPYPWAGTSAPSSFVIDGTSFSLKAGSWSVKTSLLAPNERYDTYAVYELT
jgi:hypothetical protein